MKAMFTVYPMVSVFHPLVPIARNLQDNGWDVTFAAAPTFGSYITKGGFRNIPAGPDSDGSQRMGPAFKAAGLLPPEYKLSMRIATDFIAPLYVKDILKASESFKPDIIIRGFFEVSGHICSEILGIPSISTLSSYVPKDILTGLWSDDLEAIRKQYGLQPDKKLDRMFGSLAVSSMPDSWWDGDIRKVVNTEVFPTYMPPFNKSGDETLPHWLTARKTRPRIIISFGTSVPFGPEVYKPFVEAMRGVEADCVITVGRYVNLADYAFAEPNVKVVSYLPHSAALKHFDVFINHGGFSTILAGIEEQTPMIIVPLDWNDQALNAQLVQKQGLGIALSKAPSAADIAAAIRGVLRDAEFKSRLKISKIDFARLHSLDDLRSRMSDLVRINQETAPTGRRQPA